MSLFAVTEPDANGDGDAGRTSAFSVQPLALGQTVLDRIHQSMILFAAGRNEAMKRFIVEDGAGRCDFVVSFNERHLQAAREFGIEVLKPAELLKLIGEIK